MPDSHIASAAEMLVELDVASIAFGGRGVARLDGKVYFVKDTIPGDRVRARVTDNKKRYADAEVIEWVTRSPLRGTSPCPLWDVCGGCLWLQVDYATQCTWKRTFVESALDRIGKIPPGVTLQMHPAPVTLNYRNRIHLKGLAIPGRPLQLGYFRAQSHDLVPITSCAIAAPVIDAVLQRLVAMNAPVEHEHRFKLEIMELPPGSQRTEPEATLTLFPERGERDAMEPVIKAMSGVACVAWAGFAMETSQAPWLVVDEDQGIRYHTRPGCFLQVNRAHNRSARALVRQWVESANASRVLDLYCGNGNLSLGLAGPNRYVEGVELARQAIEAAKYSVASQEISNAVYLTTDCENHLWKHARANVRFDLVITDPPRDGMYKELIPLKKIGPKHIIYMSCDPATLARDLSSLCKTEYVIREIHAFDFFPNTWHIESLVLLERTSVGLKLNEPSN